MEIILCCEVVSFNMDWQAMIGWTPGLYMWTAHVAIRICEECIAGLSTKRKNDVILENKI